MLKIKLFEADTRSQIEKEVNSFLDGQLNIGVLKIDNKIEFKPVRNVVTDTDPEPVKIYTCCMLYTIVSNLKIS